MNNVCLFADNDCAQGFLNNKSLEMIIEAMKDNKTSFPHSLFFSLTSLHYITPNTAFITQGNLTKWTFAARFNHSNRQLPELQVWRRLSNNHFTKIHGVSMEPRQTGYLNVFELDFSETSVYVQAGDMFGVYQPSENRARYSLAFLQTEDGPITYSKQMAPNSSNVMLSFLSTMNMQPLVTATISKLGCAPLFTNFPLSTISN